ncbi:MAG: hypothetical protein F4Z55_14620 [Boseongicola sp. SB0667_bin_21]|nr:hypothetical protein [Boseongicola sp. SB0667_bin_21]
MRIVAYRIEGGEEATMPAAALPGRRAAPAAELAALYHERWEIEIAEKAGEDPGRLSFVQAVRVMLRRIISSGAFPPEGQATGVIDEILKERVVSSCGQARSRGVRQKMSGYSFRKCVQVSRRQHG